MGRDLTSSSHDVKMGLLILHVLVLGVGCTLVLCFVSDGPPHSPSGMPSKWAASHGNELMESHCEGQLPPS